ncbi:SH3 domain-containing protein [Nioella aestuarii]|uniref:SH3 domain-containing protein n=1 Tax=Nioella aestuarii TaxID=1662864 RepID=UPI003D7FF6BB
MAQSTPDDIKVRVVKPWRATYSPALAVTAGERVTPGRVDDDYPGWQWVVNSGDLGGWVPADIVDGSQIAEQFDTAELTVTPGDLLAPLEHRLGWTRCQAQDGRIGWIPDPCLTAD